MDIETISTHKNSGDTIVSRNVEDAKSIAPAVFTCIPGIIPVVVPIAIPIKHAITNSIIAINCVSYNLKLVEAIWENCSDLVKLDPFRNVVVIR